MIVIAHRLATIVGYDRVLVLDRGRVAEYGESLLHYIHSVRAKLTADSPIKLMKQEGSAFRGLCMANGEDEFDNLLKLAKSSARSG
jgi:ABC-type multidrug transport system fused ATPase/permease subunit